MVEETLQGLEEAMSFEAWELAVDTWLYRLYGMGIDFMTDWNSYDAWKDGMSPKQAAKEWFKANKENY